MAVSGAILLQPVEGLSPACLRPKQESERMVDFSYTPEPHVAFCFIFVHPFEVHAVNSFLLFTSFLSKLQLFSCFEDLFFEKVSESNPMLHFGSFLSKIKPHNQPTTLIS